MIEYQRDGSIIFVDDADETQVQVIPGDALPPDVAAAYNQFIEQD